MKREKANERNLVGIADEDLIFVQAIRQKQPGYELAFEKLVKKYQKPVLNTIYRYIGNYFEAEDIAQIVFIKVWQNIKNFQSQAKFSTWLYRIVVNQCLDYRKKSKSPIITLTDKSSQGEISKSLAVESNYEQKKKIDIVKKAINELPSQQRIALILAHYEKKSYQEIADIMGTSLASVTSFIYRAKQNLKRKLIPLREKGII